MAKSPTDQIADLRIVISELREAFGILDARTEIVVSDLKEIQSDRKTDATESKDQSKQVALLSQKLDDHLKRMEVWSGRLWTLVIVLIGAVFSLASGLIVTLAKK